MKKIILSLGVIFSFGIYTFFLKSENTSTSLSSSLPDGTQSANTVPTAITSIPATKSQPQSLYHDGTFVGNVVDVSYGNVQVSATISGDRLMDIHFLQYPNDRTTSLQKSNQSLPILKQEAIKSQSAKVDIVSGATDTSIGFMDSLASALTKAKI